MSLKDASDGPVFAAKKTRINKAAIDIFGVIVKIQTLLTEASDKPYFPGSELLDLLVRVLCNTKVPISSS